MKALLWERGYAASSPRRLLDRSGAGQGSLYHHFGDKKTLAIAALDEVEAEMTAAFERLFDARLPLYQRIDRALGVGSDAALRGCPLGGLAGDPVLAGDAELRAPAARYFEHIQTRLADALRHAAADGEIRLDADADALSAALVASVQGGYVLSRLRSDPRHLRAAVRTTLRMFREFIDGGRGVERRYTLPVASLGV